MAPGDAWAMVEGKTDAGHGWTGAEREGGGPCDPCRGACLLAAAQGVPTVTTGTRRHASGERGGGGVADAVAAAADAAAVTPASRLGAAAMVGPPRAETAEE